MTDRTRSRSSSPSGPDPSAFEDVEPRSDEASSSQPGPFEVGETTLDLNDVSDEELHSLYFEDDQQEENFWNATSITGLSLIVVGIVYLLNELGVLAGPDLGDLVAALPWLAGVFIILLGFGLLSWRPSSDSDATPADEAAGASGSSSAASAASSAASTVSSSVDRAKKLFTGNRSSRLTRSRRDKKLFGVCGGIADYLGLDPTLVRIAFVVGVIASGGPFVLAYAGLAFAMPKEPKLTKEERMSIIRDS
jgi:phage shock protein C